MARVHTATARKDYPEHDIKKGDLYYYWTPYRSAKRYSKTRPKPQQLTDRDELIALFDAQDLADDVDFTKPYDDVSGSLQDVMDKLQEAADYAQEKLDNMPENMQQGERAGMLEQFIGECDEAIGELDNIKDECDPENRTEGDEPPTDLSAITWPSEF